MNEQLKRDIAEIINAIPTGTIFDAHFVIQQLFFNYSDDYMENLARYQQVRTFHSAISREIVTQYGAYLENESYSNNIHNTPSPNKCWRK